MSYVQDNLMPNEKVVYQARLTPAIFLPAIFLLVVAIAMGIAPELLTPFLYNGGASGPASTIQIWQAACFCPAGLFFLLAVITALQYLVILLTTEFGVTNQRIIAKKGFIRRHTLEILLAKVESVGVNQNLLARLFNFGIVTVTGTGGTKESFQAITDPVTVRKNINQVIQFYTSQAPAASPSPAIR